MCLLSAVAISTFSFAEIVYVPGGDFSNPVNWEQTSGGGSGATYSFAGEYGQVDSTAGSWSVMVATTNNAVETASQISLESMGLTAGDTITIAIDMIEFSNDGGNTAGIKLESWASGAVLSDSGDLKTALTNSWATYEWDYTIEATATHLKFVTVQHEGISVGYDNYRVIPEPATMSLALLSGGFLYTVRRLRNY